MRQFTDTGGHTWEIAITLGAAMRLRDALEVDLLEPERGDPPLLTRIGTSERLLGEILCELLRPQFAAAELTEAEVYERFDGETLLAAQAAFYEDLADFFRGRGRPDRARAVAKQGEVIDAAIAAAVANVDAIDPAAIVGKTFGKSPAPAGSGPSQGSSRSASSSRAPGAGGGKSGRKPRRSAR